VDYLQEIGYVYKGYEVLKIFRPISLVILLTLLLDHSLKVGVEYIPSLVHQRFVAQLQIGQSIRLRKQLTTF
jgi:hypothetical protein